MYTHVYRGYTPPTYIHFPPREMASLLIQQQEYTKIDLIIRSGTVIDPSNNIHGKHDLIISNGKIVDIIPQATSAQLASATTTYDATDCYVTPGLIDIHAHIYQYATPLGVDPDTTCLSRGVTTVVDAGSSGASTFPGLRKYIKETSTTRVLSFIHICMHGLASAGCSGFGKGGELDSLNQVNEEWATQCIEDNSDMVVGVKIRLSADCANDGANEMEAYRRARAVTTKTNRPLIVHHTFSSIPHQGENGALGGLKSGDIYTHALHGFPSSIIQVETKDSSNTKSYQVCDAAIEARKRGVLFDVGHGAGSFSWSVAEICASQSFFPDTISTDLHVESCGGSNCDKIDLCIAMSKMLHVGMELMEVVRAVTATPARAIGFDHCIGALTKGYLADITILKKHDCNSLVEDCQGQKRFMKETIRAVAVFKNGIQYPVTFPNLKCEVNQYPGAEERWKQLIVRDEIAPNWNDTEGSGEDDESDGSEPLSKRIKR